MLSTILDKVLAGLLALSLVCGLGALWYADHERQKIAPLQNQVHEATIAAAQAAADRDAAQLAAKAAQTQLKAAQDALSSAAHSAAAASASASDAQAKLAVAAKVPDVAKVLDTPLPAAVWDAIYNQPGE